MKSSLLRPFRTLLQLIDDDVEASYPQMFATSWFELVALAPLALGALVGSLTPEPTRGTIILCSGVLAVGIYGVWGWRALRYAFVVSPNETRKRTELDGLSRGKFIAPTDFSAGDERPPAP
jgi:hypothetical protein